MFLKTDGLDSPGQWSGQSWVTVVSSSTYSEVEFDSLFSETERVHTALTIQSNVASAQHDEKCPKSNL